MPKYACKKDRNQNAIAAKFKKAGYSVADTSRLGGDFPDMIVARGGQTALIEIKAGRGSLSVGQKQFIETWKGQIYVCRSEIEALAIIHEMERLIAGIS